MNTKQVLEMFVDQGVIDAGQVEDITQEVNHSGKSLSEVLSDFQICTTQQFYETIAASIGADFVDLSTFEPPPEVVRLIPGGLALLHRVFPLGVEDGNIQVAVADPLNAQTAEDLRFALGKEIEVVVAPVYQIDDLIKKNFGTDTSSMDEILAQLGGDIEYGIDAGMDAKQVALT